MALLVALLPAARAESPAAAAKRHYEAGTTAYNLGDFLTAANEYREAYKARPLSAILYNIAQAYRLGGDFKQAVFFYRSYLRNVTDSPNRAECEERIRTLEAELAAQQAGPPTPPKETSAPGSATPAPTSAQPPPSTPPTSTPPAPASTPPTTAPTSAPPTPQVASPTQPPALTATAPAADKRPASKKWIWGVVAGAVVVVGVGLGVGLALGLTTNNAPPMGHFGVSVF